MGYINKTDAIDAWKEDFKSFVNELYLPRDDYRGIMEYIDECPSADVVERKRGKWISSYDLSGNEYKRCSECGTRIEATFFANDYSVIFCPHCGSDMWEE